MMAAIGVALVILTAASSAAIRALEHLPERPPTIPPGLEPIRTWIE